MCYIATQKKKVLHCILNLNCYWPSVKNLFLPNLDKQIKDELVGGTGVRPKPWSTSSVRTIYHQERNMEYEEQIWCMISSPAIGFPKSTWHEVLFYFLDGRNNVMFPPDKWFFPPKSTNSWTCIGVIHLFVTSYFMAAILFPVCLL